MLIRIKMETTSCVHYSAINLDALRSTLTVGSCGGSLKGHGVVGGFSTLVTGRDVFLNASVAR